MPIYRVTAYKHADETMGWTEDYLVSAADGSVAVAAVTRPGDSFNVRRLAHSEVEQALIETTAWPMLRDSPDLASIEDLVEIARTKVDLANDVLDNLYYKTDNSGIYIYKIGG